MKLTKQTPGQIRIIGGKWRGRKISVNNYDGLRPTPDRVRETLFNWLQPYIKEAVCLDAFSGTGVLGFEALSRGAGKVVMLEQDRRLVSALRNQAGVFDTDDVDIICTETIEWLQVNTARFDIIFLDPPFGKELHIKACEIIVNKGHLKPGGLLYLESEQGLEINQRRLKCIKNARAGRVQYGLLVNENNKAELKNEN